MSLHECDKMGIVHLDTLHLVLLDQAKPNAIVKGDSATTCKNRSK